MIDSDEYDKMIEISGKVDKSGTYNGLSGNISLLRELHQTEIF